MTWLTIDGEEPDEEVVRLTEARLIEQRAELLAQAKRASQALTAFYTDTIPDLSHMDAWTDQELIRSMSHLEAWL